MIKILYVITALSQSDGVAAYLMNYLSKIDTNKFDITIVTGKLRNSEDYLKLCSDKGIKIVEFPYIRDVSVFEYKKLVKSFFKENHDFDIIHSNVVNFGLFYLREAKKYKVPVRIIHSHATKAAYSKIKNIRNKIVSIYTKRLCNEYFACSNMAGEYLFGKKKFTIINNAIDTTRYNYNKDMNASIREKLGIDVNRRIIGFVGRICIQKNPLFAIKAFNELMDKSNEYELVIAGYGPLENELLNAINNSKYKDSIHYLGEINYVNDLYSCFDYLIMPSLFEGLPVVGIEAQMSNVYCLFSSNITKEVKIADQAKFIGIDDSSLWVDSILDSKPDKDNYVIDKSKYDIIYQVKELENKYIDLVNKYKK